VLELIKETSTCDSSKNRIRIYEMEEKRYVTLLVSFSPMHGQKICT
jgi:hypothetical protein